MEFWTRAKEQLCWKEWPNPLEGLASLPVHPVEEVLLLALHPDAELSELVATVRVIRKTAGAAVRIIAACPHPSCTWLGQMREAGIDHVWWVARPGSRTAPAHGAPGGGQEVESGVCPALHAKTEDSTTLSVCGSHGDRMVLAARHLERWCLRDHEQCPHWKFGPGAWFGEDDG